jgi:single-strand DNA-binding protein
MAKNINRIVISGRLTAEPELKQTKNGTSVITLTIAVNNGEEADFFPVVAWRGLAEAVSNYRHRGDEIIVDGYIKNRTYIDKNNNVRKITEIIADNIEFGSTAHKEDEEPDYLKNPNYKTKDEWAAINEAMVNVPDAPF